MRASIESRLSRLEQRRRERNRPRGCYRPLCVTVLRTDDPEVFLLDCDHEGLGQAGDVFDEDLARKLAPRAYPGGGPSLITIVLDRRWPPPDPDDDAGDDDEAN